jgi:hypothetical protein
VSLRSVTSFPPLPSSTIHWFRFPLRESLLPPPHLFLPATSLLVLACGAVHCILLCFGVFCFVLCLFASCSVFLVFLYFRVFFVLFSSFFTLFGLLTPTTTSKYKHTKLRSNSYTSLTRTFTGLFYSVCINILAFSQY